MYPDHKRPSPGPNPILSQMIVAEQSIRWQCRNAVSSNAGAPSQNTETQRDNQQLMIGHALLRFSHLPCTQSWEQGGVLTAFEISEYLYNLSRSSPVFFHGCSGLH